MEAAAVVEEVGLAPAAGRNMVSVSVCMYVCIYVDEGHDMAEKRAGIFSARRVAELLLSLPLYSCQDKGLGDEMKLLVVKQQRRLLAVCGLWTRY